MTSRRMYNASPGIKRSSCCHVIARFPLVQFNSGAEIPLASAHKCGFFAGILAREDLGTGNHEDRAL